MTIRATSVRRMTPEDLDVVCAAVLAVGWESKPQTLYERYLSEQAAGDRDVLLGFLDGEFAGYLTVMWCSNYPPFRDADIPEIVDFNVLPHLRRRHAGTHLMDDAEQLIATRSQIAGIGVGLSPDYGPAQRLYAARGYVPDGRGLWLNDHHVQFDESVAVNHSLVLFLTKQL